jgi:hypothetical protein
VHLQFEYILRDGSVNKSVGEAAELLEVLHQAKTGPPESEVGRGIAARQPSLPINTTEGESAQ